MDKRLRIFVFSLASILLFTGPGQAQQAPAPTFDKIATIDSLPGVRFKLAVPDGLCRVDPAIDKEWFDAVAEMQLSKLIGMWADCQDLSRIRAGEAVEPARWLLVLAQRGSHGTVGPMAGITREYALSRWADAFSKVGTAGSEAERSVARAKAKLRTKIDHDLDRFAPQVIGPDGLAIYLAAVGTITNAQTAVPTEVASVSGWSLISQYRIGVGYNYNNGSAAQLDPLLEEVKAMMKSLDQFSRDLN